MFGFHKFARALGLSLACCALVLPAYAQAASPALTLRAALQRALAASPKLTAAERDIGIATGKRIQAGAVPNPELGATVENIAGSGPYRGARSAETTLQLSQLVELGGKREARIAAGAAATDAARWQRQAIALEIMSETATAYIAVLASQHRIQILEQQVAALDRLTPLLQRRVDAGASSPSEILRAQVAADLVRVERERTKTTLATERRGLTLMMGDATPKFGAVAGNLNDLRPLPSFKLVLDAIDGNPQLARWSAVRAQRDAELLTARLKPIPDVRASVGWRNFQESRDGALVVGISIPLPVWDRNQGDILAARESADKVQAERAVNKTALISVAGRAYDAANGALQEIKLLRTSVLPNARRASEAIQDGYAQGRFTLLELLDVQATASEAALREQEALRTFHIAVATIEGLVGRPFSLAEGTRR
jgi:cobalt-zinc-cadmium efflux system outer membrane protein